VDGFGGYNRLERRPGAAMTLAHCWAHLRRQFYELHVSAVSRIATVSVERMSALWALEEEVRGRAPLARRAARQERSAPVTAALFGLWEAELPRISGKSDLAKAIRYALSHRQTLERFLEDGRLDIDNNTVERAIRPQTITRKNALFAGSDGGGRTWASIATLLATARLKAQYVKQLVFACQSSAFTCHSSRSESWPEIRSFGRIPMVLGGLRR
jgi:transposase